MTWQILSESTILVVDDEPDYLKALKTYLQKVGCRVRTAGDGETALALVAERPPDLILLDVTLPGLDGFELCRRLKADETTRPIPVLFLTAAKSPQDKLKGFEAGAVDYIGKPFQLAEAAARVETHLTLHRMRRELEAKNRALQREIEERRRTEERIEFQASLLDQVHNAVIATDLQGRVTYWNRFAEKLYGRTAAEAIGRNIIEVNVPPQDRPLAQKILTITKKSGHWEGKFTISRKDGTTFLAHVALSIIEDEAGRAVGFVGVSYDITERKQMEAQVCYQAELVDKVSDAIISTDLDDFRIKSWNKAAEKIYGWAAEEVMGRPIAQITGLEYPDRRTEAVVAEFLEKGAWEGEFTQKCKDGVVIQVYGRVKLIRDQAGRPVGAVAVNRDITERKRMEDRLRRSQRRYKRLSENMLGIVYQYHQFPDTAFGEFLYIGPSVRDIYELEPAQILADASWMWRSIHPDDRADFAASIIVASVRLAPWQHEYRAVLPSGALKWMQGYARPERQPDGSTVWDGILIEATERKAAEQALRQAKEAAEAANRAKSSFLAMMSHELRTPLNGVLGYAQILQRDPDLSPEQRRRVEVIEHSGQHLLHLINDVLDLAKIEAGKVELTLTNFALRPFLEDITAGPRLRAESKGLQFRLETSALPDTVRGDPKRLWQILLNLLNNAVKFTTEGWITLRVSRRKSGKLENLRWKQTDHQSALSLTPYTSLRFQVEDSGDGIPPNKLETIFEPFEQAGGPAHQIQGTGLGLAVCRRLVELMGGRLFIMSSVAGGAWMSSAPTPLPEPAHLQGTLLWFDLPLPEVAAAAVTPPETRPIVGFAGQPRRVLVIEDDLTNQTVFGEMLTPLGFEVFMAGDGESGLKQALNLRPDVLIVDMVMPGLDGFEVIRRLRRREMFQNKLIIAASASVQPQQRQRCLQAGSDAFLSKPVQAETLYRLLKQHLELTWLYADPAPVSPKAAAEMSALELVLPSREVLQNLRQAVLIGDVTAILEQIGLLRQVEDKRYQSFARRVQELTETFHLNELAAWLERLL